MKKSHVLLILALGLSALIASCAQPLLSDPSELSAQGGARTASVWHLESTMKNATALSQIAGVYWSARDMDSSPIGNHHFITLVYESASQCTAICSAFAIPYKVYANQKGLNVYYSTIGAFTDNGAMSGNIVETFNEASDCTAVKEQVNPKKYIFWYKPDYDYEAHRVAASYLSPAPASTDALIRAVLQKAKNFNAHHHAGATVAYVLYDENCACMVGSLFNSLGMSAGDRLILGEFTGVDWGEEELISAGYFD